MTIRLRISITLLVLTLAGLFSVPALWAAEQSTCIGCHSDESILKALFTPPKLDQGEGEG